MDLSRQQIITLIASFALTLGTMLDFAIATFSNNGRLNWQQRITNMRRRPWDLYDATHIFLVLALFFAVLILVSEIMDKCSITLSHTTESIIVAAETIVMQIIAIATIEFLRRKHLASLKDCFSTPKTPLLKTVAIAIVLYIAIMPILLATSIAANHLLQFFNVTLEPQDVINTLVDSTTPTGLRYTVLTLAVTAAPLTEELIFRGILLPATLKEVHPSIAICSTSLLFAAIHANIETVTPLFVLSVGLSLSYIYTRNILVPIIIHAIFNAGNLAILYSFQM